MQSLWVQEATKTFWGLNVPSNLIVYLKFWPWWHEYHMWDEQPHQWWLTLVKRPGPSCLMIFHQLSTWGSCFELKGSLAFWSFLSCSAISWDLLRPGQDPSSWVIHLQLQVLAQNIKGPKNYGPKKITINRGEEKACDFFRWETILALCIKNKYQTLKYQMNFLTILSY